MQVTVWQDSGERSRSFSFATKLICCPLARTVDVHGGRYVEHIDQVFKYSVYSGYTEKGLDLPVRSRVRGSFIEYRD